MKPHQALNIIVFRGIKVQRDTQSLIQSVLVKHPHQLPRSKSQSSIKIYKYNGRLTSMVHAKKLELHIKLRKQVQNTLPGEILNTVTEPLCLLTLIRSKTGDKQQRKQLIIKETFHRHSQNELLRMYV